MTRSLQCYRRALDTFTTIVTRVPSLACPPTGGTPRPSARCGPGGS
ncbi:hypothetical protein CcI6DRAFT_03251 [Frankia sp. CcI6]|nr:hypothetical protein CcI6DRAFT_03251 [Frankia sp. CcI6]KEZ35578.1 hypothetical protein CEDDRAFT_03013 [Frankia sp. CeD]KFB03917.1 hypothetical protein ALLO2DRAFT_03268 [Frankia sp. Allo2]